MTRRRKCLVALVAALVLAGCGPGASPTPSQPEAPAANRGVHAGGQPQAPAQSQAQTRAQSTTLIVGIANEPPSVGAIIPFAGGFNSSFSYRPFNALLALVDARGAARPYLAEALPQLNTETWQVFPDGRMETRYRLKSNLTWHDGTPLTANDFVFAWQVASTPGLGFINPNALPFTLIDSVEAPDDRSLVLKWGSLFPGAEVLQQGGSILGLPPLPRHILDEPYRAGNPESFAALPYWTTEFVGTGPYRLDSWELGSSIDASAFDGHVLGRPKIDRLRIQFVEDPNVALAFMRAGTMHFATDSALDFPQALDLKKDWGPSGQGLFLYTARSFRMILFQHRPEHASPRAMLDPRVRKAIAHAVDKQAITDTLFGGEGRAIDTIFDDNLDFYPQIDSAITKYPLDLRASERLMRDGGFAKGSDGIYTDPNGRFVADYRTGSGGENDIERAVMGSTLRQAGFDITETALSPARSRDGEERATFPGMYGQSTGASEANQFASLASSQVAGPPNRWRGRNRAGWSNREFDELAEAFSSTLDNQERIGQRIRAAKLVSDELPQVMLFWNLNPEVLVSKVKGPVQTAMLATGGESWNIHEWEMR